MYARRSLLAAAGAFLLRGFRLRAQQRSPSLVKVLARQTLSGNFTGLEATLVEVTIPAGPGSPVHRHPGFILGYILDGEMQFGIQGSPDQHLKQGATFFEPVDAIHTKSRSALPDKPVRLLAFSVAKQGSQITLPV